MHVHVHVYIICGHCHIYVCSSVHESLKFLFSQGQGLGHGHVPILGAGGDDPTRDPIPDLTLEGSHCPSILFLCVTVLFSVDSYYWGV